MADIWSEQGCVTDNFFEGFPSTAGYVDLHEPADTSVYVYEKFGSNELDKWYDKRASLQCGQGLVLHCYTQCQQSPSCHVPIPEFCV